MELEEMKTVWAEMSAKIESQKKLTDQLIIQMKQDQYSRKVNKLKMSEMLASIVCFGFVVVIAVNFQKYDTVFVATSAILCVAFLLWVPYLSLSALFKMSSINITGGNFKDVLAQYAISRQRFLFVQKLSFYLSFVFMIICLPVMIKVMGADESKITMKVWMWYIPIGATVFVLMAKFVYGYYHRTTVKLDKMLKELEE